MINSSIGLPVRAQFAGHETFPLRLLWLKKAFDAIGDEAPSNIFQEQEAIARFGVGRNMAVSMKYWAIASGFFHENNRLIAPTPLGIMILKDQGLDPYIESAATIWLAHWNMASSPEMTTTAFYAFNGIAGSEFSSATLVDALMSLVASQGWRASRGTLKRDVDVFLRSYARRDDALTEDAAEPLLAELGLIREARFGGWYEFARGPKPSLPDAVFVYGVERYWAAHGNSSVLTAEQLCFAAGSPGRIFKLDEDSVITRLMRIAELTDNAWRWTDTAGLRQIQRSRSVVLEELISAAYAGSTLTMEAA